MLVIIFFIIHQKDWKIVIFDVITFYFKMFLKYVNTIEYVYFASSYYIYIFIHAKNSYWYGFQEYSCPALALAAIGGKNKAFSGGNGGTTLQNKGCIGSCGNGCKCDDVFFDNSYHESGNMNQYANSSYLCFYVSCVNVIVEEAFRNAKVQRSSHRKSTSL